MLLTVALTMTSFPALAERPVPDQVQSGEAGYKIGLSVGRAMGLKNIGGEYFRDRGDSTQKDSRNSDRGGDKGSKDNRSNSSQSDKGKEKK